MVSVAHIKDPEQLRQVAALLEAENRRLHERLATLVHQLAALKGKSGAEQLQLELTKLQEQMAVLQQKMFGRSSEKRPHTAPSQEPEAPSKPPQRGHGPKEQPALPLVEQRHELAESERSCQLCSGTLEPMGEQTEDSQEITVVRRQFVLVVHKRQKYRCRCNGNVQTAPGPPKLIAGGRYSLEFAVEVALQKYGYHLPLERQVKIMRHPSLPM